MQQEDMTQMWGRRQESEGFLKEMTLRSAGYLRKGGRALHLVAVKCAKMLGGRSAK